MLKPEKLANEIINKINSGYFNKNNKFPSENSLCIEFGFSRSTVRKGLAILKDKDYVYSKIGQGHFISNSKTKLTVQPKEGKTIKVSSRKVDINYLDNESIELLKQLGFNKNTIENQFSNNIFIKFYYSDDKKPFHTKLIFINNELEIPMNIESIKKGVISFYNKYGITIKKRNEITTLITPPGWLSQEMGIEYNAQIPTVAACLYNSKNNVIEISLEYWSKKHFQTNHLISY